MPLYISNIKRIESIKVEKPIARVLEILFSHVTLSLCLSLLFLPGYFAGHFSLEEGSVAL